MSCRVASALLLLAFIIGERPARSADDPASGVFLIASPALQDPNFRETVVLVTQPRQGPPFGVIINRPLEDRLSEVFPRYPGLKARNDPVFFGGPVALQGVVFLVRTAKGPPKAAPVLRDVYLTADIDWVEARLHGGELAAGLRVYAGHSGWGSGQLQNEIGRGDWHVIPADADTIFRKDPASLWPELVKQAASRRTRVGPAARRNQGL
jgi:putative transcriptional regulator